jgi:hypothetical protein
MSDFFKNNKITVITTISIVGLFILYFFFFGGIKKQSASDVSLIGQNPQIEYLGPALVETISQVNELVIDRSIFNDPVFGALADKSITINKTTLGRSNPFAPFGLATSSRNSLPTATGNGTNTPVVPTSATSPTKIFNFITDPWAVIQKLMGYWSTHDSAGVNSVSFRQVVCTGTKSAGCNTSFDALNREFSAYTQGSFSTEWSDDKQIILSTAPLAVNDTTSKGYRKTYLYFIIEGSGNIKFIGRIVRDWTMLTGNTSLSDSAMEASLQERLKDTDMDGLADKLETCTDPQKDKVCVRTDPYKRDSNDNGYWDGTEKAMK